MTTANKFVRGLNSKGYEESRQYCTGDLCRWLPDGTIDADDTFPRQHARTQRFTLGAPRDITVSADGERVIFLRSASGSDSVNALWVLDVASGTERLVGDPRMLLATDDDGDLPPEERARRERTRESEREPQRAREGERERERARESDVER